MSFTTNEANPDPDIMADVSVVNDSGSQELSVETWSDQTFPYDLIVTLEYRSGTYPLEYLRATRTATITVNNCVAGQDGAIDISRTGGQHFYKDDSVACVKCDNLVINHPAVVDPYFHPIHVFRMERSSA